MKWLEPFQGAVVVERDPLGRNVTKIWVRCEGCKYEKCQACGGAGGWYKKASQSQLRTWQPFE